MGHQASAENALTNPITLLQKRLIRFFSGALAIFAVFYTSVEVLLVSWGAARWVVLFTLIYLLLQPLIFWWLQAGMLNAAIGLLIGSIWTPLTIILFITEHDFLVSTIHFYVVAIIIAGFLLQPNHLLLLGGGATLLTVIRMGMLYTGQQVYDFAEFFSAFLAVFVVMFVTVLFYLLMNMLRTVLVLNQDQALQLEERNAQLESALTNYAETQKQFEEFFKYSIDVIYVLDTAGVVKRVSPSVKDILGWQPAEMVGQQLYNFVDPEQMEIFQAMKADFRERGYIRGVKVDYLHKNGGKRVLILNAWTHGDYAYGIAQDMTKFIEVQERERKIALKQQAVEMEARFLTTMYHELKTPITALQLSTELMQDDRISQERLQNHIQRAAGQVQRLRNLINETLQLRRLIDPAYQLDYIEITPDTWIKMLIHQLNEETERNRVQLTVVEPLPEAWMVDADITEHILANLIENALKYSEDRVAVSVAHKEELGIIRFEVIDYGIGIPAADLPRIFEPFYRAGNSRTQIGTGLGLSIAYDGAKKLGGNLTCEYSNRQDGTLFRLDLPLAATPTPIS